MSIQEKNAHIASFAVAPAPYIADQATAEEFMRNHYSDRLNSRSLSLIHTVFSHPSIKNRSRGTSFALDSSAWPVTLERKMSSSSVKLCFWAGQ